MMAYSALFSQAKSDLAFMRKSFLRTTALVLALLAVSVSHGQGTWDVGFAAGIANYMGDIGDGPGERRDFIWDLQEIRSRPALGVFARRKLDRDGLWHIRGDFSSLHISGHDKHTGNPARRGRNLHFRNIMREASIRLERDLFQQPLVLARQRRAILTIRGFLGVARLQHNPQARVDINNAAYDDLINSGATSPGEWHSLSELQTEGVDYSDELGLTTIPFGLSAIFTGQKRGGIKDFFLSLEIGFRLTKTDYLDDISGFYADPTEMTPLGAALSSQSNPAVLNEAGPEAGSLTAHSYIDYATPVIRGNKTNDDAYGSLVVSFGKVLHSKSRNFNSKRRRYKAKRRGRRFRNRIRMRF